MFARTPTKISNRYNQLRKRLLALNQERLIRTERRAQYKLLHQLMELFNNVQDNVQPNLVTNDGELGNELNKMKVLIARVREKLNGLQRTVMVDT